MRNKNSFPASFSTHDIFPNIDMLFAKEADDFS